MNSGNRGFSLLQVLIAMAVTGIISYSAMSLMQSQSKEMTAMSEKLQTRGAEVFLDKLFEDRGYCQCYFQNKVLNRLALAWQTPLDTEIPGRYESVPAPCSLAGVPYFKVGEHVLNTALTVSGIQMKNIVELPLGSGSYNGDLVVELTPGTGVRSIKNIAVKTYFSVDIVTGLFQGCSSGPSAKLPDPINYQIIIPRHGTRSFTAPVPYNFCALTSVQSGGGDGGGADRCEVSYDSFTRLWTLSGHRGDDPTIVCKMNCFQ